MAGKKKSGCRKPTLEKLLLATAILNLVKSLLDFIGKLIE